MYSMYSSIFGNADFRLTAEQYAAEWGCIPKIRDYLVRNKKKRFDSFTPLSDTMMEKARGVDAGMFYWHLSLVFNSFMLYSHMFYADDAVFMVAMGEYLRIIDTIIYVLKCFHRASGLSINLSKSSKVGGNMSRIKSWDEIVDKMMGNIGLADLRLVTSQFGEAFFRSRKTLKIQDVDVASKLSQENLTWSFRRVPRSGVEQDQLTNLTTYVEGVVLGARLIGGI
ncbi:hypothetical protein Tco_0065607 [Tanacetum coccineum]